jgi:hypothetical protein
MSGLLGCGGITEESAGGAFADGASEGSGDPAAHPGAGTLTAGEWSDLTHWNDWLTWANDSAFIDATQLTGHQANIRYPVRVEYDGLPVPDVAIELIDSSARVVGTARTNVEGQAWLFPGTATAPFTLRGPDGVEAQARRNAEVVLTLVDAPVVPPTLDVMFVIDSTGSMCDELAYIQTELADVIDRIGADAQVRTAVSVYRDHGDEYVVRQFPFREQATAAAADLAAQACAGGGDYPEAADEALESALEQDWSASATARILFLVLDAPPHADAEDTERLQAVVETAQEKGVRIIPVAASGMDRPTEFAMRILAVLTGGTYVFLTDDSGIGNSHLEPSVGEYDVEPFNDLLVRLLRDAMGLPPASFQAD